MKRCARCGSSDNEFTKDARASDGLNSWCKPCTQSASKKWYEANKPKRLAVARRWYDKNKEKHFNHSRKWAKEHPEKAREISRNRRARVKAATGTHTAEDVARLMAEQCGLCVACARSILTKYHVDHIVALVNGGSNGPENLQLLCPSCNMKKGRRDMAEFLRLMEGVAA